MNLPTHIADTARKFQIDNDLDVCDIPQMLAHYYVHAFLGMGVSFPEEEFVAAVELVLEHGVEWNLPAVAAARSLPVELRNLYKFGDI